MFRNIKEKINGALVIKVLCCIFVGVFCACVLANLLPGSRLTSGALDRLEKNQTTVLELSGATVSASVALSALPNDFASPLANLFAEANKYLAFILGVILFEKIVLVNGVRFALTWGAAVSCVLFLVSLFVRKDTVKRLAVKLAALSLAVVLIVPVSTWMVEGIGKEYMDYVETTIADTRSNTEVIEKANDADPESEQSLFQKLETAFQNASSGMSNLIANFKNLVKRCAASIAIIFLNTFIAPLLVFVFMRWLLKELFSISLPTPPIKLITPKEHSENVQEETQEVTTV